MEMRKIVCISSKIACFAFFFSDYLPYLPNIPAGRAKNDMPISAQQDAISFPGHVMGTVSP